MLLLMLTLAYAASSMTELAFNNNNTTCCLATKSTNIWGAYTNLDMSLLGVTAINIIHTNYEHTYGKRFTHGSLIL